MKENRNIPNSLDGRSSEQSLGTGGYTDYNFDLFSDVHKQRSAESIHQPVRRPVSAKERERRSKLRRKRIRRRRIFIGSVTVVLLCLLIVLIVLLAKSCSGPSKSTNTDLLKGSFVYEQNTVYEFDGKGNGCMCITDSGSQYHYEYTYTIKEDHVMLDFKAEEVRDATYTFKLSDDKLTITGGEGTAGGTYTLTKR